MPCLFPRYVSNSYDNSQNDTLLHTTLKNNCLAKMQCIGSCLNHAQKRAVLSKIEACACSMQLIHSLTCQIADSGFTDVYSLILLFV